MKMIYYYQLTSRPYNIQINNIIGNPQGNQQQNTPQNTQQNQAVDAVSKGVTNALGKLFGG